MKGPGVVVPAPVPVAVRRSGAIRSPAAPVVAAGRRPTRALERRTPIRQAWRAGLAAAPVTATRPVRTVAAPRRLATTRPAQVVVRRSAQVVVRRSVQAVVRRSVQAVVRRSVQAVVRRSVQAAVHRSEQAAARPVRRPFEPRSICLNSQMPVPVVVRREAQGGAVPTAFLLAQACGPHGRAHARRQGNTGRTETPRHNARIASSANLRSSTWCPQVHDVRLRPHRFTGQTRRFCSSNDRGVGSARPCKRSNSP